MSPIQQMLLGVGAKKSSVFVDDVFSTHVYAGNSTARSINNGINLSESGGMVWIKSRDNAYDHYIVDTERGALNRIRSNSSGGSGSAAETLTAFNNNGFALGTDSINLVVNASNKTYSSWSFRKSPAFTICEWTGNNSTNQTISHQLGSIPGCIMIKSTSHTDQWTVYHRGAGQDKYLYLNESDSASSSGSPDWSNISSTSFEALGATSSNENGYEYVAYVFAGGESTAATARSVDFVDGSDDYLSIGSSSDYDYGTGDFCIEGWYLADSLSSGGYHKRLFLNGSSNTDSLQIFVRKDNNKIYFNVTGSPLVSSSEPMAIGQWTHIAVVRYSSVITLYVNGVSVDSASYSSDIDHQSSSFYIGTHPEDSNATWNGKISNFRVVKGSAVYTSSFKPPTEPLTNITNTTILCCNNISVIGSTVTPGTITANSSPTASTDSPFDDPAGFVFGESGSESVIKTGSYIGNGSTTGPEINLGWEPQWVLLKSADTSNSWFIFDSMRGIISDGYDAELFPNATAAESQDANRLSLTPTGFKLHSDSSNFNTSGDTYIYTCIRRSDGYCGKPPELGTGVFAMDTGNSSSTVPCFDSGFPVDFLLQREFASQDSWITGSRHTGNTYMYTNATDAEAGGGGQGWDSNVGGGTHRGSSYQAWMWKRHAGFDVITDKGDGGTTKEIAHGLNAVPQMIWRKNRDGGSDNWQCYHFGVNSGTNPHLYRLRLNTNNSENADSYTWVNAPTATHFTVGSNGSVNRDGDDFLTMLFTSVDGISKVGFFSGQSSDLTVTFGFQPRFLMVKRVDSTGDWNVYDTTRGLVSGADKELRFNNNTAQSDHEVGDITSTGFTFACGGTHDTCHAGGRWIYYAHA